MIDKMNKFMFEGKEIAYGVTWNMLWICIGSFVIRGILDVFLY